MNLMKHVYHDWNEKHAPDLGLKMCTRAGIKDEYQGVQGACPRQAVTGTGGTAERSDRRAVGAGLKLVYILKHKEHSIS